MVAYIQSGSANVSALSWQWSAAAYQVATVDAGSVLLSSSCNGYPTSQTSCNLGGIRSSGGSNFCGNWSTTAPVVVSSGPLMFCLSNGIVFSDGDAVEWCYKVSDNECIANSVEFG